MPDDLTEVLPPPIPPGSIVTTYVGRPVSGIDVEALVLPPGTGNPITVAYPDGAVGTLTRDKILKIQTPRYESPARPRILDPVEAAVYGIAVHLVPHYLTRNPTAVDIADALTSAATRVRHLITRETT